MKNLTMKKVLAILFVALLIVSISSVCFASGMPSASDFNGDAGDAEGPIKNVTNVVLGVAQVIGVAVAVVMLVILAIKYISAAPSEKAEIKKSAYIYVVGALFLFGGVALLNIIQKAGENIAEQTAVVVVCENKNILSA